MSLTIEEAEVALGLEAGCWVAKCHGIATGLVDAGLAPGRVVRGMWLGPIAETLCDGTPSPFAGRPLTQHSWAESEEGVLDPTRWAFEGVEPYIFTGPRGPEYDVGSNIVRSWVQTFGGNKPPSVDGPAVVLSMPSACADMTSSILDGANASPLCQGADPEREGFSEVEMSIYQAHWLANLDPERELVPDHVPDLYRALQQADLDGLVPIDNWNYWLPED